MIYQHTLPNGLRIFVDVMKDVQSCTLAIGVGTGSINETKEQNGISHFLEHMAFKGTKKRSAFDIAHEVDSFGGAMNAFTSSDKTVYYIKSQAKHLTKSMDILADILLNSTFAKEELERERGVILQELAATLDTPDDIVFDFYKEKAYGETSHGRTILGSAENIKSFNKKDFKTYMDSQYVPESIVVSVAGNVDYKQIFDLTEKYFGKLKHTKQKQISTKPKYLGGDLIKTKKDLSQVQFVMGFETIPFTHAKYYTASVASGILGGGMSSRFFQEVREKLGLCYTVTSFYEASKTSGLFTIYSGTSPENVKLLEDTLMKELNRSTNSISKQELSKVLEQYKSSIIFANESTSSRAQKGISNLLAFERYIEPDEIIKNVEKITTSDIEEYITKTIAKKRTMVVYGNIKK